MKAGCKQANSKSYLQTQNIALFYGINATYGFKLEY